MSAVKIYYHPIYFRYVIGDENFQMLTIEFKGRTNHMEISKTTLNTNGVTDKRLKGKLGHGL